YIEGMGVCSYVAGYCCILGHMFPLYFHFKGGKGVVAAIGMMLILDWRVFLIILGSFLIIFSFSKIISLGSLVGAALYAPATFVITYFFIYKPTLATPTPLSLCYVFVLTAIALMGGITVIVKHHGNIKRLLRGEEKKITAKK
ncbi:MAG: glycerol-3-phosphate acyltransferase, partial [Oscillospiraceae bacterium]|nr:glycerol-3-phosphate acyltransferase [Oscillospiraceae bacterium]